MGTWTGGLIPRLAWRAMCARTFSGSRPVAPVASGRRIATSSSAPSSKENCNTENMRSVCGEQEGFDDVGLVQQMFLQQPAEAFPVPGTQCLQDFLMFRHRLVPARSRQGGHVRGPADTDAH